MRDTIGRGMTWDDVTMNSFTFSRESCWRVTKSVALPVVALKLYESPIENNLNKIIKIVLHVAPDVPVGFTSFLDI